MTTAERVTAGLGSHSAWITMEVLVVLTRAAPLPITTGEVLHRASLQHEYGTVLRMLNRLARMGEVEKWPAGELCMSAMWRRLGGAS